MSTTVSLTVTHSTDAAYLSYITASIDPTTVAAPNIVTGTATAYDTFGNSWDISTLATWSIPAGGDGGSWLNNVYASNMAGDYNVQAVYEDKVASASLTVTHATDEAYLTYITASMNPNNVAAPNIAIGTATAYDSFGNSWDISTIAMWSIQAGGDGGSWSGNIYTSQVAGTYTVQAAYLSKTATAELTVTHATGQAYLDHISIAPKIATVNAGISQAYTATAYDIFGNNWSVTAVYSSMNSSVTVTGNLAYSNFTGSYPLKGTYNGLSDTATLTVTGHLPNIASIAVSPKTALILAGATQTFTAAASDGYNTWDVTSIVTWSIDSAAGGSWNLNKYTSAYNGTWTVKATLGTLSDSATLTVIANSGLLNHIVISPKTSSVAAGIPEKFTATAYDLFGNSLGDVSSLTTFSCLGATVTGNSIKTNNVGSYIVTANYTGLADVGSLTVTGYVVTFTESGLKTGTSWNVTFGGQNYSSITSTIFVSNLSAQSYTWNTSNNIQNGQTRYIPGQISGSFSVPSQVAQNIVYSTQYLVTYATTGNFLSVSVTASEWVNSGGKITGLFPTQVINGLQDTRCNFLSDNRSATISQPTTITGTYQTQYYLTVSTQHSTAGGTGWYNDGSTATASVDSGTIADVGGTKYLFSFWTGDASGSSTSSNDITMSGPKTATANWKTQYYLSTSTSYGTVSGAGWYDSGSTATATLSSSSLSGGKNIQHAFKAWSGDASGTALTSIILMTSPKTASASWNTQYMVTYSVTGNALTITLPSNEWVSSGSTAHGNFVPSTVNSSNDTQCLFLNDNRTSFITSPTTIIGNYQTQYKVTFNQTGIESDAKGTILTISGMPEVYSEVAHTTWVDKGTQLIFSFNVSVPSTIANKQYTLSSVNVDSPIIINKPTLIQGNYQAEYSTSLYAVVEVLLIILAIFIAVVSAARYRSQRIKKQQNLNEPAYFSK